jgi:hypothetical protein
MQQKPLPTGNWPGMNSNAGLEEVADGVWSIYLGTVLLGRLDERTYVIHG